MLAREPTVIQLSRADLGRFATRAYDPKPQVRLQTNHLRLMAADILQSEFEVRALNPEAQAFERAHQLEDILVNASNVSDCSRRTDGDEATTLLESVHAHSRPANTSIIRTLRSTSTR